MLVLGLGGGAIPSMLAKMHPEASIDIVEIDLEIALIASKFFNFATNEKIRLYIDDASNYINHLANSSEDTNYDIIIMDAYLGDKQPLHLCTNMYLEKMQKIISNNGILIWNLITGDKATSAANLSCMKSIFKNVFLLRCENSGNVLAFCSQQTNGKIEKLI